MGLTEWKGLSFPSVVTFPAAPARLVCYKGTLCKYETGERRSEAWGTCTAPGWGQRGFADPSNQPPLHAGKQRGCHPTQVWGCGR